MKVDFQKYHGAGNDFIIIDNRAAKLSHSDTAFYAALCHRHFGIGADGMILYEDHPELDFKMIYYNSDGRQSSMCGNGGRCIVRYAADNAFVKAKEVRFEAIDGIHDAVIHKDKIELQMQNVSAIEPVGEGYVLDTGSPHYVVLKHQDNGEDFIEEARRVRNGIRFKENGINVNFVRETQDGAKLRTYERGVENETLACGTGVTAAALVLMKYAGKGSEVHLQAEGGKLSVKAQREGDLFKDIWLIGPAVKSFDGSFNTEDFSYSA